MSAGRIAAIITCHNLGRWLVEALASVETQARPASEIVVVDDRSTDVYTRQVLSRLERDGTCVVHATGQGVSAARNSGARLTSSEYLMWLDADDVLAPEYFEKAAAVLDGDPDVDFVSCAMRAFGASSYEWAPSSPDFVSAVSTGGVPHASTLIRRRLWEGVGGFDEDVPSFELLDFWASVFERGLRGVILEQPLLHYRIRPGSGYRRSIQSETYQARLTHFYEKHRAAVEEHGLELLKGKEAFLAGQKDYGRLLEDRVATLEAERDGLRSEIDRISLELAARGVPRVHLGDLGRTRPLSETWGRERGTPIDRRFIEAFLNQHRVDVRGRVLEVRDSTYTERFGGERVTTRDVVDIDAANPRATIIADLRDANGIPADSYDCIILTQTLHLIDDMPAVLRECSRILRPGGVLLLTGPSVIRVDDERGSDGDYWRLTEASARTLFASVFPIDAFDVTVRGNVLACAAFLYGMASEELVSSDLDHDDPRFPLVVAIRAVKPSSVETPKTRVCVSESMHSAVILVYHRVAELTPDSHHLCTPPDVFREHMRHLHQDWCPMPMEDLIRATASGRTPERSVAVTFDDGYLDALTAASPILQEFSVPATFFVNTDRLDEEHERWWDRLERLFLSDRPLPAVLTLRQWQDGADTVTASDRAAALERLGQWLWPLDADARLNIVRDVVEWAGGDAPCRDTHRVLTGAELRTLAGRSGHAIGAHTVHHLALPAQSIETKRREIAEDKRMLEQLLGRTVPLFAYPYGEWDGETLSVVREAGFTGAVTVVPGRLATGANRWLLPRVEVMPADHARFPALMRKVFDNPQS